MPTYKKAPLSVNKLADAIIEEFETHHPLRDAGVTVDYVYARPTTDENGIATGDAITHHGHKALGLCLKLSLKDRAMGRADAEITLDAEWWELATEEEQKALLDHELHHIAIKLDKRGLVKDDLGRPVIQLRKHDIEIGWFKVVASRHGDNSLERSQARQMMNLAGDYFWPDIYRTLIEPPKTK